MLQCIRLLLLLSLGAAMFPGRAQEYTGIIPWSLRDHYTFSGSNTSFLYDVKSTEWTLDVQGIGEVVKDVQAEIVFKDGTTLRLSDLKNDTNGRGPFAGPLGAGILYTSQFKPEKGLVIKSAIARYTERPFLTLYIDVKNIGEAPVEIVAVRPALVGPGAMENLSTAAVTAVRASRRASFPVMNSDKRASLFQIEFKDVEATLAIGILQTGKMKSDIQFVPDGKAWQGNIECRFDPPLTLAPQEEIQTDPLWISFGTPEKKRIMQFFSWSLSVLPGPGQKGHCPAGWVTVGDDGGASDLTAIAGDWSKTPVDHALVPGTWEGRPGSLEGASPRFPKDMKTVAQGIVTAGMKPGITVDPLIVDNGDASWTALSTDGARWLNPTIPAAHQYGVKRMEKAVRWGFQFFVVKPSAIPDEVLSHFKITRVEADTHAFAIMAEAAGELPVLPSSNLTLGQDLAAWQEAADGTAWLREYQISAGPIRVDAGAMQPPSAELSEAIRRFAGPIEIVGSSDSKFREAFGSIFAPAAGG